MAGKNWYCFIRVDGCGKKSFTKTWFPVSDEMFEKINNAVEENIPLEQCDFYDSLKEVFVKQFNLIKYVGLYEPERRTWSRESEEDYMERVREYEKKAKKVMEDYRLGSIIIFDPGEEKRLKERFIGRKLGHMEKFPVGSQSFMFQPEYLDREIKSNYFISVNYDSDDIITNVRDAHGSCIQWKDPDAKWGECKPDFEFIAECLEECLVEENAGDGKG